MADISKEIQDFQEAVYGEEVRGSLISLAEKVNTESTAAKEAAVNMAGIAAEAVAGADEAVERADAAVSSAQEAAKDIQDAADRGDFSATVSVDEVVTAQPGEPASVENVGTEKDARFRFKIPKGEKGEKGKDGTSINITGKADSVEELPVEGEPNAAYIIGENVYVWDGTQWKDMGKLQGPPGESATIQIGQVTDGETASVENVGTPSQAVLNFILPKGKDGRSVGLGEPEITVDAGIGEPYAEISISGPDDARVISFKFHNLKGEPGTKGAIDENASVSFTAAEERENIQSGETLAVILGKLEKIVTDLKDVAFSGDYKDLTGAPKDVGDLTNEAGYVTTDTWKANTAESEGYVASGSGQADKVWGTDAEGNPGWKDRVKAEDLENDFVSKSGDAMTGTLEVPTLVLGSEPSDKIGAMWIG
nr:hypothetical protein [uncultured Schaedlerella sp.]